MHHTHSKWPASPTSTAKRSHAEHPPQCMTLRHHLNPFFTLLPSGHRYRSLAWKRARYGRNVVPFEISITQQNTQVTFMCVECIEYVIALGKKSFLSCKDNFEKDKVQQCTRVQWLCSKMQDIWYLAIIFRNIQLSDPKINDYLKTPPLYIFWLRWRWRPFWKMKMVNTIYTWKWWSTYHLFSLIFIFSRAKNSKDQWTKTASNSTGWKPAYALLLINQLHISLTASLLSTIHGVHVVGVSTHVHTPTTCGRVRVCLPARTIFEFMIVYENTSLHVFLHCLCVYACPFPSSLGCKARDRQVRAVPASFGVISALVSPVMLNLNYHSSSHRDPSFILMWPGRHMH